MAMDEHREEGVFRVTLDGQEYRVPQYCPHRAGRLAYGEINRQRKTISCPLHYSVFSLESGEQLSGPACGRLAVERCAAQSDSASLGRIDQQPQEAASFVQGSLAGFANPQG